MPKLLSIQVGQPQEYHATDVQDSKGAVWQTSIFKIPVAGPVQLSKKNLAGDGQADLKNHGGEDKAINIYPVEHYPYWQTQLELPAMTNGGFGENFTTTGLLESEAAIGDTFRIGTALIQISQPRQPCWKLSRRWGVKDLALQVQNIGYTGWYFRVLKEGIVEAGQDFELLERPYPQWTIAEANRLMHHDKKDWDTLAQLVECPALSKSWKKTFRMRLGRRVVADSGARLSGK